MRLGWEVETNWTHPVAYALFLLLRPVGGALILVVIYRVVVGGPLDTQAVEFLVVGAAMWAFVLNGLQRVTLTVVQEREWFRVLKYVVLTPLPFPAYMLARSAVWLLTGSVAALVVLAIGAALLGLDIRPGAVDWASLVPAMMLGLTALLATALGLAGITMALARHPIGIGEAVQGTLYLVSGAVFPPALLPGWAEPISRVLPFTYWLEAVRRALLPSYDPSMMGIGEPFVPLLVTTLGTVVLGAATFWYFDRRARALGAYDRTTEY